MDKPNGLTIVAERDLERRIWPLAVRKLWGVGPKTEERLARLGVATIGDLAQLSEEILIQHFGQAHGHYLYRAARGIDESPLLTHWEPKSISRETTFQQDTGDWPVLTRTLVRLTDEAVETLREEGYLGQTVTVKLRFADFDTHTHALTLAAPTDDLETIEQGALRGLHRFSLIKKVRLIGVRVGGIAQRPRSRSIA